MTLNDNHLIVVYSLITQSTFYLAFNCELAFYVILLTSKYLFRKEVFMKNIPTALPTTNDRRQINFERDKAQALQVNCITIDESVNFAPKLDKPLEDCRVALIATVGIHQKADPPFIITGDPSYRIVPGDADYDDLMITHVRYPNQAAHKDLDCVYPLNTLRELSKEGIIGSVAPRNYGLMGHIPRVDVLIQNTADEIADQLEEDDVDIAILSPG